MEIYGKLYFDDTTKHLAISVHAKNHVMTDRNRCTFPAYWFDARSDEQYYKLKLKFGITIN